MPHSEQPRSEPKIIPPDHAERDASRARAPYRRRIHPRR